MKVDLSSRSDVRHKLIWGLATDQTVASLARPLTPLSVNGSIPHAIETIRQYTLSQYPVVNESALVCMLSEDDLAEALLARTDDQCEQLRLLPLSAIIFTLESRRSTGPTLLATEPITSADRLFLEFPNLSVVPVLDERGRYFGVLSRTDLIAGRFRTLAPPRVGGMATPLGVYLTDGIDSGGVGTVALMLAGGSMMFMFLATAIGFSYLEQIALAHHIDVRGALIRILQPYMPYYAVSLVQDLLSFTPVLFVLFFRFLPIAGYHAAEHQVVHCIERGEPLIPDRVAAMPRPHPRCGTNLVAAAMIFGLSFEVLTAIFQSSLGVFVPSGLITLLTWRPVGTFLQQYFTTRKATLQQLQSGIVAGEELLAKYRRNTNRRVKLPMRIWRMGFLQMLGGIAILAIVLTVASIFVPQLRPYIQDIY